MKWIVSLLLFLNLLMPVAATFAQSGSKDAGQWCGFALIENVPDIDSKLPLLSRLTSDEKADSDPSQLFQSRISLDGTKAIVEGCWIIFPTRDLIVNWLSLSSGDDQKQVLDDAITYSLFAPDGSHEESAASVRDYLSKNAKDWEPPCEETTSCP